METSVLNSSSKTRTSLENLKKLGFYQTPEKFIKKNSCRLCLEKNLSKLKDNKESLVYVSPYSNLTLLLMKDDNTAFINVISENCEIIYQERLHHPKKERLMRNLNKNIAFLKEVIDDQLICNYDNCKKQPKIVKNKKGIYYWICPANSTHKKNQS